MLYEDAYDNIKHLVNTIGAVDRRQIYTMFRNYDQNMIEGVIWRLKKNRYVVEKKDGLLERDAPSLLTPYAQELITRALWIPAQFGEEAVFDVYPSQFPTQLYFITTDWRCMDITIIYPQTMDSQLAASKRYFSLAVPSNSESDATKHIAMLYGKDMRHREHVATSGVFQYYAEVQDNMVQLFRCEETGAVLDLEAPIINGK